MAERLSALRRHLATGSGRAPATPAPPLPTPNHNPHSPTAAAQIPWETDERTGRRLALMEADSASGFHHPYFLTIPPRVEVAALVIESNNIGADAPTAAELEASARSAVSGEPHWVGARVAERLGLPLLMPVFPRTIGGDEKTFVHQLDRNTLLHKSKAHARLDLQLLAMASHALATVRALHPHLPAPLPRHLVVAGFSSSAVFATRFGFLHYPATLAVVAGGIGGLTPVPDERLDYPLGTRDYETITGRRFDADAFEALPQLFVNGDRDSSCPFRFPPLVPGSDGAEDLSESEARIVQREYLPVHRRGEFGREPTSLSLVKELWKACLVRLAAHNIEDVVVPDTGHSINPPTVEIIDDFLEARFLSSAGRRGWWGNPGPLADDDTNDASGDAGAMPAIEEARLWPEGAPGERVAPSAQTLKILEAGKDSPGRESNIEEPTITVYPAPHPNGAAVLVCPGGGYW